MSNNPKRRWHGHHHYDQLNEIGGVRVAYLFVDNPALLRPIESALIAWFNPPLNAGYESRVERKIRNEMHKEAREEEARKPEQSWGGVRSGSGRKPDWRLGATELTRIPKAIAQQIIELSREVDENALDKEDAIALINEVIALIKTKVESDF
jgi:hypothetical protein